MDTSYIILVSYDLSQNKLQPEILYFPKAKTSLSDNGRLG